MVCRWPQTDIRFLHDDMGSQTSRWQYNKALLSLSDLHHSCNSRDFITETILAQHVFLTARTRSPPGDSQTLQKYPAESINAWRQDDPAVRSGNSLAEILFRRTAMTSLHNRT